MKQAILPLAKPAKGIGAKDESLAQTDSNHQNHNTMTDTICAILTVVCAILIYVML